MIELELPIVLAPLAAACGAYVPMMSGRGLGHTGGTLDKLESIPGWRADLTNEAMMHQLEDVGAVICAAGAGLAPADKKLYALRDVTGTVEALTTFGQIQILTGGGPADSSRTLVFAIYQQAFGSGSANFGLAAATKGQWAAAETLAIVCSQSTSSSELSNS